MDIEKLKRLAGITEEENLRHQFFTQDPDPLDPRALQSFLTGAGQAAEWALEALETGRVAVAKRYISELRQEIEKFKGSR